MIEKAKAWHIKYRDEGTEGATEHIAGREQQLQSARTVGFQMNGGLSTPQQGRGKHPRKNVDSRNHAEQVPPGKDIHIHDGSK